MVRTLVHATLLAVSIALFVGCAATSTQSPPTGSAEATGCCCAYGNCRGDLTQTACVKEAEFQGWTYRWHAGACTSADKAPVLDTVPPPAMQR